MTIDKCI